MTDSPDDGDRAVADHAFRSLVDGANDGLFVIDAETGAIEAANQTVCDWLGYERDRVLDMTIFDCQTTFSGPDGWQTFVRRVRDEDGVVLENEIVTRGGSTVPVEGSISVVTVDGADRVVAVPRRLSDREE